MQLRQTAAAGFSLPDHVLTDRLALFCQQNRVINAYKIAIIIARQAGDGRLDKATVVRAIAIPEIAQSQCGSISWRAVPSDLSQIRFVDEWAGAAAGRQLYFEDHGAFIGIPAIRSIPNHDRNPDAFSPPFTPRYTHIVDSPKGPQGGRGTGHGDSD